MYEYPFGNGQQLNLDWFLNEWKNLLAAWEAEKNGIEGALQAEIDRAEAALADVFSARDAAAQSAANALESKNAAAQSASDASGYLATVRADANTASNAAQNAAQSESNAAESAQTALASKNTAANSERNAAQSEANANSSKNAAAQSAADALANKNAAAQSAADALANKNAAAQSAEDAENAAASVESSAEQIATNAFDISILKSAINFFNNYLPSIFYPLSKMRLKEDTNSRWSIKNNNGVYEVETFQNTNPTLLLSGDNNSKITNTGSGETVDSIHFSIGRYKLKVSLLQTSATEPANLFSVFLRPANMSSTSYATTGLITNTIATNCKEIIFNVETEIDLCVFCILAGSFIGTYSFYIEIEKIEARTGTLTNTLNRDSLENVNDIAEETKE